MVRKIYRSIVVILLVTLAIPNACLAETNNKGLREVADEYLISKVGEDYFSQYFTFRFVSMNPDKEVPLLEEEKESAYICYFHRVVIGLNDPTEGYNLDMPVYVRLNYKDDAWQVTESNVPGCLEGDKNCNPFSVTKRKVIEIVKARNINDDCPRGWFIQPPKYSKEDEAFVWEVNCNKNVGETSVKVYIDAATGELKFLMGHIRRGLNGSLQAFD